MVAGKVKKPGKRGRKPAKIDLKAKLERSRQSARECRARKKLRYQYLEELVSSKERAICALREELEMVNKDFQTAVCYTCDRGSAHHLHQQHPITLQTIDRFYSCVAAGELTVVGHMASSHHITSLPVSFTKVSLTISGGGRVGSLNRYRDPMGREQ